MHSLRKKISIIMVGIISMFAVAFGFFQEGASSSSDQLTHKLRIIAIQQLIAKGFDRFVTMPLGPGSDHLHLTGSQIAPDFPGYYLTTGVTLQDDLDAILADKIHELESHRPFYASLQQYASGHLQLDDQEIAQLKHVYLFKDTQDLKDLGYVVSSYRTRINTDAARRKDNIAISYRNIGNVRVLNPQQQLSFMDEIHYDPAAKNRKRDTVSGLAIMGGVSSVKGGGICGASRGINAAIITNKAFDIITRYNHTRTWKYLYQNSINGKEYRIPGLDVAVYRMGGSQKDFVFKNIRPYPVVLVMNYDGSSRGEEELFVLSHEQDRGTLDYVGKQGNCYSRKANDVSFRSCYSSVSGR